MYENIVVPIDLLDTKNSSKPIFNLVLNLVKAFDSKLHLLYIIPDFGIKMVEDYLPKYWLSDQKAKYEQQFQQLIKNNIPEDVVVNCTIDRGPIYDRVIDYVEKKNADLIVVSAVRPKLRNYMLGPNASKIVRHAPVSVLVVRD